MYTEGVINMAQISIRMDDELRRKTEEVLDGLGLNISSAVNIFAHQIVMTQGIPFPLTLSNVARTNRQDAVKAFFEFAKAHPIKVEPGYKFNRDECYDDE
jgi:addiction module RelB/DinJ family antitoxin